MKEGAETQQMLVDKIVGLQRACARRQEKLDFLEEHVEQVFFRSKFCSHTDALNALNAHSAAGGNQEEKPGDPALPHESGTWSAHI